jgi:hypothetical protein
MIVRFLDIDGVVDHQCLIFLFISYIFTREKKKDFCSFSAKPASLRSTRKELVVRSRDFQQHYLFRGETELTISNFFLYTRVRNPSLMTKQQYKHT